MLELSKSADKSADNFRGKVESVLGEEAEVRARKQEIVVECKDLDEVTSREDICAALKQQFNLGDIDQSAIKRMKKAYGGTQTAIISLPAESAIKLITAGKVRVGWVVCRLREQISLKRCFRCLDFGHFAAACTSQHDRSRSCRKCGEEGHLIKDCTGDPRCMLCSGKEGVDGRHIAGSSRCPVYRRELNRTGK